MDSSKVAKFTNGLKTLLSSIIWHVPGDKFNSFFIDKSLEKMQLLRCISRTNLRVEYGFSKRISIRK